MAFVVLIALPSSGEEWITILLVSAFLLSTSVGAGLLIRPRLLEIASQISPATTPHNRNSAGAVNAAFPAPGSSSDAEPGQADERGYVPAWISLSTSQLESALTTCRTLVANLESAVNSGDMAAALGEFSDAERNAMLSLFPNVTTVGSIPAPRAQVTLTIESFDVSDPDMIESVVLTRSADMEIAVAERFRFLRNPDAPGTWKIDRISLIQTQQRQERT